MTTLTQSRIDQEIAYLDAEYYPICGQWVRRRYWVYLGGLFWPYLNDVVNAGRLSEEVVKPSKGSRP